MIFNVLERRYSLSHRN